MGAWVKANGGPPAVVVVGLGLVAASSKPLRILGFALVVGGLVWFFLTSNAVQRRIPWTVVRKDEIKRHAVSDAELGKECSELANEIHDWLAEYRAEDPNVLRWGLSSVDPADEDYRDSLRAENAHRAKFAASFTRRYATRASWLLGEIRRRGLVDEARWWRVDHALSGRSDSDVQLLAELLAAAGGRLTRGDS